MTFSRSAVTSLDWASYPILTFPEVPDITGSIPGKPKKLAFRDPAEAKVLRSSF